MLACLRRFIIISFGFISFVSGFIIITTGSSLFGVSSLSGLIGLRLIYLLLRRLFGRFGSRRRRLFVPLGLVLQGPVGFRLELLDTRWSLSSIRTTLYRVSQG